MNNICDKRVNNMEVVENISLIVRNPKVRGGRPCIAGTGLRVTDIVMASLFHNRTPSEIASDYDIFMAEVHAALAYYYQHKDELDADIRQQIATAAAYKEQVLGSNGSSLLS
jgi:uncharacterized protein (DUF433 family)